MNHLDVRTVLLCYVLSDSVCAAVMTSLWWVNRGRYAGLGFWLADFVMQFFSVVLIALRGIVPVPLSIMLGTPLIVAGTVLLYQGLERYTGKRTSQWHNYFLLAGLTAVQAYFTFVQPSLLTRRINFELAMLAICSQCAWLMLRRVDSGTSPGARLVGVVFSAYGLLSLARIPVDLAVPAGTDLFAPSAYNVLAVMVELALFVALTFSVVLMVNRRLFVALDRDIAERKRVEEALRESEEKFALAFRTSPYAIAIVRMRDLQVIEANEAFHSFAGCTREEAANGTWRRLWLNQEDHSRVMTTLLRGETVAGEEFQFKKKNGKIVTGFFSAGVFSLRNEKCVLSSIADITERKRAEEALKLYADKLARSNAELERFAYVASHDLQEPLRMVASFTQLLAERYCGGLDETAGQYIHYAVDGARRMQQLISDLLAYSRLNGLKLDLRQTECEAIVRSAKENLRMAIEESDASIGWDPLPALCVDQARFTQLFQNLLGNAIKFRRKEERPQIRISAADTGAEWLISVQDNGIGIDPKQAGRVFQIFQRLHTGEEYPGTGIGLAVCQKVVERHGGRIWVESEPGKGATFRFTLPKPARME